MKEVQKTDIKRNGSQPSGKGPAAWFTGNVRIDPLFQPNEATRPNGSLVTFEPGARCAWHSHPPGQTLVVTAGCGLARGWAGFAQKIRAGGVEKDVTFVKDGYPQINKQIDAAYRSKYRHYPSAITHINSPAARAATIRLVPR